MMAAASQASPRALALAIVAITAFIPGHAAAIIPVGEPHEVFLKSDNPRYKVFGFIAKALEIRRTPLVRPFAVAWEVDNIADEDDVQRSDSSYMRLFSFTGSAISDVSSPYPLRKKGYAGFDQPKVLALAKLEFGRVLAVTERVKSTRHGVTERVVAGQYVDYGESGPSTSSPLTREKTVRQPVTAFAVGLASGGAIFTYYQGAASTSMPARVPARRIAGDFRFGPLDKDIALGFAAAPEQFETLPTGFVGLFRQYGSTPRMYLQRYDNAARKIGGSVFVKASATASYDVVPLADGRIALFETRATEQGGSRIRYWLFSPKLAPLGPVAVLKATEVPLLDVKVVALLGGGFLMLESAASAGRTLNAVTRYTDAFEKKGAAWKFEALDKVEIIDLGRGRAIVALKEPDGKNRLVVQGLGY